MIETVTDELDKWIGGDGAVQMTRLRENIHKALLDESRIDATGYYTDNEGTKWVLLADARFPDVLILEETDEDFRKRFRAANNL